MPQERFRAKQYEGKASEKEERTFPVIEIKAVSEDDEYYYVEAYLSKFNEIDSYNDTIMPGAYAETIAEMVTSGKKIKMLWQHRSDKPIGVWDDLKEDSYGLFARGRMPKKSEFVSKEVWPQLQLGSVDSTSIGYRPKEWEYDTETDIRTLKNIKLREGSLVTFPADEFAVITNLKSLLPDAVNVNSKEGAFNARIEIERKGAESEVKEELSKIYSSFELEDPFEKDSKLTVIEVKHLTKKNLSWAIKNMKFSTNASNFIAESIKGATDSEQDHSKGRKEESAEDKVDLSSITESLKDFNNMLNNKE